MHKETGVVRKSFSFDRYSISHVEAENYRLMRLCLISSGAALEDAFKSDVTADNIT